MDAFVPFGMILNATFTFFNSLDIASGHKLLLFLASSAIACLADLRSSTQKLWIFYWFNTF